MINRATKGKLKMEADMAKVPIFSKIINIIKVNGSITV